MSEPQIPGRCYDEQRVLIMTPFGRDSAVAAGILGEAGLRAWSSASLADLVAELDTGAGCVVITREAVEAANIKPLIGWLEAQPSWSDLPVIIITEHRGGPESNPRALRVMEALGNVTFLERPFRPMTFLSVVKSGLRSRRRQLQAREHMAEIVLAERHKAAEVERQRALFEQTPGFVIIMRGPEHVVEFVNREHRRLFGSGAWPGKPIRDAFPDIAGQGFYEVLDAVYATGEAHTASAAPARYRQPETGEERTRYFDFIYSRIHDDEEVMSGVFCEGFDVTDRVEAGADLLAAEERLRLATEAADIGWWDVEEGHGELFWPPRVKAMFGISADAPVSMDDFYAGLHPDDRDRVAAVYAGAADPDRRQLYDVEYRTIGKEDGVLRWVAAKGRGMFDESGRCKRVIGTAIDITERKLAQEERAARQKEDAELRDQFIAVLGHDLRNPLASVAAGTQVLLRRPERASEVSEHIQSSIARMSELIENVLDFARGRLGGGFVISRDSGKPLTPVLVQVVEELREVHPERVIMVDINLREPVECDPQRIGQLLSNLLGNAFVYGAATSAIQVRARAENGQFELSVANAGEPIEPPALERLFLPFFRGKVRGSREGLGLGLYICSEIAKAHGGTIDVTSDSEITRFTLRMPTSARQSGAGP
jgi:PAS domain S-box-containing protein